MDWSAAEALCALYLPGLGRPFEVARRRWRQADSVIRVDGVEALLQSGLGEEALVLGKPGLLAEAAATLNKGEALTAACADYPWQWLARLGESAPPALRRRGIVPAGRFLGVVGSRQASPVALRFASEVAREARRLGYVIVSGGARGCDTAARPDLEIVPYGLGPYGAGELRCSGQTQRSAAQLSLAKPDDEFSTALAMERNGLIYPLSEATVVVDARFKQGGSWHGAVEALRRRRCRVIVRNDPANPALRALIALGGVPLSSPAALAEALASPGGEASLFCPDLWPVPAP